jgi:hypothetical protein
MSIPGSVFGIDATAWSAILAGAALLVSIYGVWGSRKSSDRAERSAMASERSAEATANAAEASGRSATAAEQSALATIASTAAAERSAGASETSAEHSGESARAALRLAAAQERALELAEQRAIHEDRERAARDAPRWAPTSQDERGWWTSDDNNLFGVLVNAGSATAIVTRAVLDLPTGGRFNGTFGREPAGHFGGGETKLELRPGMAMRVAFQSTDRSLGQGLQGDVRPRVKIECTSPDLGWEGEPSVELLRRPGGGSGASRWLPRPVA